MKKKYDAFERQKSLYNQMRNPHPLSEEIEKKEVVIENVNFERQCPVLMNSSFPLLEVFRTFHNIFVKKTKQNSILFVFEVQNRVCCKKKK